MEELSEESAPAGNQSGEAAQATATATATGWQPDVLGEGFEYQTIDLGVDNDVSGPRAAGRPPLVATLVRSLPQQRTLWERLTGRTREFEDVDVLYVHGWSDYFFQTDVAKFWTDRGARFFALDLRRYGRSLREGQTPGYIANLTDYDQEIDLALSIMRGSQRGGSPQRKIVLLGHSTGGLVLSLWCSRHPGAVEALILNSPWLEFQLTTRGRQIIAPLVHFSARHIPLESAPQLDYGFYWRAQQAVGPKHELARVNTLWRPETTHPVHSGWLSAILIGHQRVHEGLGITIPICVLLSARTTLPTRWNEELTRSDSVLDVDVIAEAALHLGSSVTIERIDGALHDIFLSATDVRTEAYGRLERWTKGWRSALPSPAR